MNPEVTPAGPEKQHIIDGASPLSPSAPILPPGAPVLPPPESIESLPAAAAPDAEAPVEYIPTPEEIAIENALQQADSFPEMELPKIPQPANVQEEPVELVPFEVDCTVQEQAPVIHPDPSVCFAMDFLGDLCARDNNGRHNLILDTVRASGGRVVSIPYLGGFGKNIICTFSDTPTYKKIWGAHFDRVPHVPGANDNGAAVAQLVTLVSELNFHGFKSDEAAIMFFDNEELMGYGPDLCGSYHVAKALQKRSPDAECVVLDVCGSGDSVVMSSAVPAPEEFRAKIRRELDSCYIPSLFMWTPQSDSRFLSGMGLKTVLLSTLPAQGYIDFTPSIPEDWSPENKFPPAWRKLHSKRDNMSTVFPETMDMMLKFLRHSVANIEPKE